MKRQSFYVSVLMLFASLMVGALPATALAQQYLGEFCWETTETGATMPTGLVRLDVHMQAGGTYSLVGTMEDFPFGVVNVVNGSAEILPTGATLIPTVSATLVGSNPAGFAMINLQLDPTTFDGSSTGIVFLTQPSLMSQTTASAMALVACP